MLGNVNLFEFDMACLNSLGYRKVLDLYGNDHYAIEYFFREHSEYEYYWVIEYDIFFSGDWECLWELLRIIVQT